MFFVLFLFGNRQVRTRDSCREKCVASANAGQPVCRRDPYIISLLEGGREREGEKEKEREREREREREQTQGKRER